MESADGSRQRFDRSTMGMSSLRDLVGGEPLQKYYRRD